MSTIDVKTAAEAEQRATLDYLAASDTVIEVDEVNGFDEDDDSYNWNTHEVGDGTPIRVRVIETCGADLANWNDCGWDHYLDPYWNVELVEPHCAVSQTARSLWICAPTAYRVVDAGKGGS